MNISIYIPDLNKNNEHLMPWRTVIEVSKEMKRAGHRTFLLNGIKANSKIKNLHSIDGIDVFEVPKPFCHQNRLILGNFIRKKKIDRIYFPIAFVRDYSPLREIEKLSGCKLVWYVPGGWYFLKQVIKASFHTGIKVSLPFFIQTLMPKAYFVNNLKKTGGRAIITMTEYTAKKVKSYGYNHDLIFAAPPGKAIVREGKEEPLFFQNVSKTLGESKYFLFFGPATPIRGVNQILNAFSYLKQKRKDFKLVCLFRKDTSIKNRKISKLVNSFSNDNQIYCIWDSVNGADLNLFLKNCFAVLKPFLIVPSEIPLAVIETAGYGKPVICTGPSGTGDFIKSFGVNVPHADFRALAQAMEKLLDDKNFYDQKCRDAIKTYEEHPSWADIAKIWLRAGKL